MRDVAAVEQHPCVHLRARGANGAVLLPAGSCNPAGSRIATQHGTVWCHAPD